MALNIFSLKDMTDEGVLRIEVWKEDEFKMFIIPFREQEFQSTNGTKYLSGEQYLCIYPCIFLVYICGFVRYTNLMPEALIEEELFSDVEKLRTIEEGLREIRQTKEAQLRSLQHRRQPT